MAKSYEQWLKEIKAQKEGALKQNIDKYNSVIDKEIAENKAAYDQKILQTQKDFESLYDLNEVQRIINKRQLAERMANIGVKDSGLNRTQNTAVQLTYSNVKSDIGLREQTAVASLKSQLAQYISAAQAKKSENEIKLTKEFEEDAAKQASDLYKAELDAENERIKLNNEALKSQTTKKESSSNRSKTINLLKESFADLNKTYKGDYTKKDIDTVFGALLEAEEEYGLSAFECMTILSNGKIEYTEYTNWKKDKDKKTSNYESSSGFLAGVNYAPRWLRNDYVSKRKEGY